MLRGEQEEGSEDLQELDVSVTDDEEVDEGEQGSAALIHACGQNTPEVGAHRATAAVWRWRSLFLSVSSADGVAAADGRSRRDCV